MTEDKENNLRNIYPPVPSPRPRRDRLGSGEFAAADDGGPFGVSSNYRYHRRDYENVVPADDAGGPSAVANVVAPGGPPGSGEELHRPVPAPRRVKVQNEGEEGAEGFRGTKYENVSIISSPIRAAPQIPSAPPYHALPLSPSPSAMESAAAGNATAATGNAAECGDGDRDRKYKTSSPGDLFKSIGTTSRMLTESIGERVVHKSRKVAENVRNTSSTIVNWSQETGRSAADKLKSTVGRSSTTTRSSNTSGGSGGSSTIDDEDEVDGGMGATGNSRRRSASKKRDEGMMQNIKFSSPLLDESSTVITTTTVLPRNTTITTTTTSKENDGKRSIRGRGEDRQLAASSPAGGQTYDIPRRGNKPSNLRPSPPASRPSSAGSGSVRSASESNTSPVSSAATTTTPDRWAGGTVCREVQRLPPNFERISLARPNLYTTIVPKAQRVEKGENPGLGWIPPPPPLVDSHKHKSESNLHDSAFCGGNGAEHDRQKGNLYHLYGKLNILPRLTISSSSSSGGGCGCRGCRGVRGYHCVNGGGSVRSSMADSEEDNMLPELRQLMELGSSIEVQPKVAAAAAAGGNGGDDVGGDNDSSTVSSHQIFSRQTSITTLEDTDDDQHAAATATAPVAQVGQRGKKADAYLPVSWFYPLEEATGNYGPGMQPPMIVYPPMAGQPPTIVQPPMAGQVPMMLQPPMIMQPPMPGQPPMIIQLPMTGQPPMPGQPPVIVQPPMMMQPPMPGQPPVIVQPPMMLQPPMPGQPPVIVQPPMMLQPSMPGQQPMMVQPPMMVQMMSEASTNSGGGEQGNRLVAIPKKLEPLYGNADGAQPIYATLSDIQPMISASSPQSFLQPVPVDRATAANQGRYDGGHDYDAVSFYSDIIDEFDPLAASTEMNHSQSSLEPELFFDVTGRDLALINAILGTETYAKEQQQQVVVGGATSESETAVGGGGAQVDRVPQTPERSDSLLLPASQPSPFRAATVPVKPKRTKHPNVLKPPSEEPTTKENSGGSNSGGTARSIAQIVHQNLSLPSDSMENLLEESLVQPYLSVVEEESMEVSGGSNNGGSLDLSYPKRQPRTTTNWYVDDVLPPDSASNDNHDVATTTTASGRLEPEGGSPETAAASSRQQSNNRAPDPESLPSYFEAIGGTDPLFERGLAAVTGPSQGEPPKTGGGGVASKLLNALKRRSSLNRGSATTGTKADGGRSGTTATTTTMVPKPPLTERLIAHQGHVLKIPSGGKMGEMLLYYELAPRSVVLRERVLHTFHDPQQTIPKETIALRHLLALQCVVQHRFIGEGGLHLHCFEIVLGLPKPASGGGGLAAAAAAVMSSGGRHSPDALTPGGGGGSQKTSRASYMFATHKRSDRNLWMAKVLQSVTDVFPEELLREFLRGGWCYVKQSLATCWAGAWVLLTKRRLHIFSYEDRQLDELDLRKARCIGMIEDSGAAVVDAQSLAELYVEAGPTMFIDCPPFPTLYLIMSSPRETQIWRKMVRQAAHQNGSTLHTQQLTRGDVPVLIDRCINFIYAQGAMSEGIYRRSGSVSAVARLLRLFANDAFDVQLTRADFSEHDVAGALKKFIRELPGSFFGSFAASFTSIGMLNEVSLKVDSYQQLLQRLPRIEHSTLRKLIGHLAFIASLEQHNRMGIPNLAMIWGSTLMANSNQHTAADEASGGGVGAGGAGGGGYHQSDADVVADLIRLYPRLFPVSEDELRKDQLMLGVLQRYHAAAENLSDAVKQSGDLKVWITIDCDNITDEQKQTSNSNNAPNAELTYLTSLLGLSLNWPVKQEKQQVNVDITPTKTASDVCKELASRTVYPWNKLTLYEIVLNGALVRPIHYGEKVLEIVVRWTYWDEADRKNNYLTLRPTTTLNDVYRTIQKSPVLEPVMEVKFADPRTKALRLYQLVMVGQSLSVQKQIDKKDKGKGYEEMCKIDLTRVTAYIGCEPKRDKSSLRWALTLISKDFTKRTRDEPFVGHIFGGLDFASQILWYSSILYSHHKDDILPSGDVFFQ